MKEKKKKKKREGVFYKGELTVKVLLYMSTVIVSREDFFPHKLVNACKKRGSRKIS